MKQKKIVSILLVAVLMVTLFSVIGGTLAFLIAETEPIVNTFELGDITYELILKPNPPEGYEDSDVTLPSLTPTSPHTAAAGSVKFTLSSDPVLTGYKFLGWYAAEEGETPVKEAGTTEIEVEYNGDASHTVTNGDKVTMTLYAQWERMDFTVSFDPNAVDAHVNPTSKTVTYQQPYGVLPTPTREFYKFVGWTYTSDSTDTYYVTDITTVEKAEDHTLYAQWIGDHEYTITYYANSANASFKDNQTQVTDKKVQDATYVIKNPTELDVKREGYVWTEWNTEPDGTGEKYLGGREYTTNSDLTLYAIWATKTEVKFKEPVFVNMNDTSIESGANDYSFTIKCKTKSGADGIAIPLENLIVNEAYRLTFSVTFNNFLFYRDDDGDKLNKNTSNGSYIFGTNIIDQYKDYDDKLSIISQKDVKTTSKYENMQWSTTESGHFEVFLDFVPTSSTMYWFWETTDIRDGELMTYEFNNFNIQNRGPVGPRVEFEDLTVTFQTAPTNVNPPYNWPNYPPSYQVRHKNYFHTESFGIDYLNYRVFGYAGHERMTIPITGLVEGQWYELNFTQDLSGATVYNSGASLNQIQLYGCAVSDVKTTADDYAKNGCVDTMNTYQDLRRGKVGNNYTTSIKFKATESTMYWHWTLGDLIDYIWSDISLSNVTLTETDEPATYSYEEEAGTLDSPAETSEPDLPEGVIPGEESFLIIEMPDMTDLETSVALEGMELYGWWVESDFGTMMFDSTAALEEELSIIYEGGEYFELWLTPLYVEAEEAEEEIVFDEPEGEIIIDDAEPEDEIILGDEGEEPAEIPVEFELTGIIAETQDAPVVGTDYVVALTPEEGYILPETISVCIDGETYIVDVDTETNLLTIPGDLITDQTAEIIIVAEAVEVVEEDFADEDPADEVPVDEDPVDEDPVDEDPADDEDPVDEDPADDEDPVGEDPADDEDPVGEDPVVETPADGDPVGQESNEEPIIEVEPENGDSAEGAPAEGEFEPEEGDR